MFGLILRQKSIERIRQVCDGKTSRHRHNFEKKRGFPKKHKFDIPDIIRQCKIVRNNCDSQGRKNHRDVSESPIWSAIRACCKNCIVSRGGSRTYPRRGRQSPGGRQPNILVIFSEKPYLVCRAGRRCAPLNPPPRPYFCTVDIWMQVPELAKKSFFNHFSMVTL